MNSTQNRWLIAAAAVVTHLCLGSVYAWSVFALPMSKRTAWTETQVTWAFSIAIAMLGLTAAFGGPAMARLGPRRCVGLSATLFGVGVAGAGLAVFWQSLPLLYGLFGIIGGVGLGLGYAPLVAALLKWFPDRRGLATGMAVCGFGLGAMLATKAGEPLLSHYGIVWTFFALGASYLVLIFAASRVLCVPPEGWRPAGWIPPQQTSGQSHEITTTQALAGGRFWLLWLVFFANISAGIMLIPLAKGMAKDVAHLSDAGAGWFVAIMGLFNGGGRLAWSAASDKLGRSTTLAVMLAIQVGLFLLLAQSPAGILFVLAVWLILSCYGGGFAITPAFIADTFGSRNAGTIYGAALTAWSAAALISPRVGTYFREQTQSYTGALYVCAGLLMLALVLNLTLWALVRRARPAESAAEIPSAAGAGRAS